MIRIGIICPSEIALRRFLPSLNKSPDFEYVGVAVANEDEWFGVNEPMVPPTIKREVINGEYKKAQKFVENFGGCIFDSYESLIKSDEIDALYLPLPPALHYKWAKLALQNNKNVFLEKPATIDLNHSKELIEIARERGLTLHENYMFAFHNQISIINDIIRDGELGQIRMFKLSFGFPKRESNDFRYNKTLGGGALFDCGGYTIKYSSMLLGESARIVYSNLNYVEGYDVDIFGSAAMINEYGETVQVSFGMDNNYKCELEIWGSLGCLSTNRIFTAPANLIPECIITKGNKVEVRNLDSDDAFLKSINRFLESVQDESARNEGYESIIKQATFINEFIESAERKTIN